MEDVPGHRLEGQGWLGQPGEPVHSGLQAVLPGPCRRFLGCVFLHSHPSNLLGSCLFVFVLFCWESNPSPGLFRASEELVRTCPALTAAYSIPAPTSMPALKVFGAHRHPALSASSHWTRGQRSRRVPFTP